GFEQSLDQSDPDSEYDYYGMWVENTSGEFINNVDIIVNILDKDNTILKNNNADTTVPLAPGRKCWFKSIYEKGEQVHPEPSGYRYYYGINMSVSDYYYDYESGDLTTDIQAAVIEKSDPEGAQTETTESAAVVFAYQDGTRSDVELMNMTGCKAKRMRIMRACVLDGGETINARDFGTPREISEIMAVSQIVIRRNWIHQYVRPDTLYDIELEDQDGKVWTFFNLALGRYAKVELCLEDDYTYYIGYTHEGQTEDFKGYRIRRYETPKVRYVIAENNLKARNIPDDAGEIFAQVLPRTSVELLGEAHGMKNGKETKWYLTRIDDRYGYIVKRKKYYTDSLENDPNAFYRQYQIIQYLEMTDMILVQEDAESQIYTGSGSDTTTAAWRFVDYTDSYGSYNYSADLFKDDPNRDLTYGIMEHYISQNTPGVDEYSMIGYDTLIEGYPGHFLHYEVDWEGEPLYVNMYEYFKDNILVFCRYTSRDKNPNPVCVRSGRSMRGIA
ncbi:MAG: FxLYD domain-containing protein, partial [Blautia sp.]|nr:FxLYD domain-containing protein [Blautia sp.]